MTERRPRGQSDSPQTANQLQPIRGLLLQLRELSGAISIFHAQVCPLRLAQLSPPSCLARTHVLGWCPPSSFPLPLTMTKSSPSPSWTSHICLPLVCIHIAPPSVQASTASPQVSAMCPNQPLPPSSPAWAFHKAARTVTLATSHHLPHTRVVSPASRLRPSPVAAPRTLRGRVSAQSSTVPEATCPPAGFIPAVNKLLLDLTGAMLPWTSEAWPMRPLLCLNLPSSPSFGKHLLFYQIPVLTTLLKGSAPRSHSLHT